MSEVEKVVPSPKSLPARIRMREGSWETDSNWESGS